MMKRFNMFALVVLLSAATMGCTTTQKWMAGGAVVGATVGGIWASNADGCLSTAQGALVGGATGAAAAGLVGNVYDYNYIKDLEAKNKELTDKVADLEKKVADLEAENARLKEEIQQLRDAQAQFRATILDDQLFKSGSAQLSDAGKKALGEVAAKIKSQYPNSYVSVQGHTDSQPIKISKWDDNWQPAAPVRWRSCATSSSRASTPLVAAPRPTARPARSRRTPPRPTWRRIAVPRSSSARWTSRPRARPRMRHRPGGPVLVPVKLGKPVPLLD